MKELAFILEIIVFAMTIEEKPLDVFIDSYRWIKEGSKKKRIDQLPIY